MAGLADILGQITPNQSQPTSGFNGLSDTVLKPDGDMIANILIDRFGSPAIAAGLMGNIDVETGGSFDAMQKQKGGGAGEGLFQFTFEPMKEAYRSYLKKNGIQDSSYSQIDFVQSAISSKKDYDMGWRNRQEIQDAFKTGNPEVIAGVFSDKFEKPGKPHNDRRMKSTNNWFNKLKEKK